MRSAAVVVIGDALLDVRVAPARAIIGGSDVPARIDLLPGGQGANVAVRLARRGVEVELVAALADDPAGAILRSALQADGVALRQIAVPSTGTVVALLESEGERTMLSHRVPFGHLVSDLGGTAGSWLVVSGYLLTEPMRMSLAQAAIASPARRRVILGCALADAAVGGWLEAARSIEPDLVILNEAELERLGTADGLGMVAVTDAGGARVMDRAMVAVARASTPPGAAAIDTTGAGDAFAAAFIASLAQASWPPPFDELERAVGEAVSVSSDVARVPGAQGPVRGEREAGARA